MTNNQAISHLIHAKKTEVMYPGRVDLIDTCIAALRAQREAEQKQPCAWCKSEHEYTIIDDDFGQPLRPSMIHFCFNCGRELKEDNHGTAQV